ncbi:urea carboxylase-associated family protein [Streptomyces sp. NPDC056716]|uniref:urea carboxylase-associated family protein n=1 Tax=unclassified Streptomyces TaxID=2593676 RepID=UPI003677CDB9
MGAEAAYRANDGGALDVDREFYRKVAGADRELVDSFEIPIRSGRAWKVPAGHLCRLVTVDGPQVGDLNVWNANDPRERLWAARTRQLQRAHVTTFDRLWSNLPFLRPLLTITDDTLADYGRDGNGGRVHDLLGTRCDPYVSRMLSGTDFDFHCHSNLVRAVLPYGLTEFDVHDVLNVFQCTGLNEEDRYFMSPCPARPGDHFEFFAETDLLCALSTCPGGDLSVPMWGPDARDPLDTCHPIGVEVHRPDPGVLSGWAPPRRAAYKGLHGMALPHWPQHR